MMNEIPEHLIMLPPQEHDEGDHPPIVTLCFERRNRLRGFLLMNDLQFCDLLLLDQALTHRSFANENLHGYHNERLEFLGDSVIALAVSQALFRDFPEMSEGEMSRRRSAIVSRASLGRRAWEIGIGEIIRLGVSEEHNGGRARDTIIGSAIEAVVGAVYLSCGLDTAIRFVELSIYKAGLPEVDMSEYTDFKSRLQELVQREYHVLPHYALHRETGPEHDKIFEVIVSISGECIGRGCGNRKRTAENAAAQVAFENLNRMLVKTTEDEPEETETGDITLFKPLP